MTETEKTYNTIMSSYKPVEKKKLISEAKETKKTIKKEAKTTTKKQEVAVQTELDEMEKSFVSKYIEYTELTLLNQSAEQLTATFEKTLGPNADAAIKQLMNKIGERETKIKELAKDLNTLKDQMIKETEKARAKETLINLASGIAAPVEKAKPQIQKPQNAEIADVAASINVVQSKKTKKK